MVHMCTNGSKRPNRIDHIPSKYHVLKYRLVDRVLPRGVQPKNREDRIKWHKYKERADKRQNNTKISYYRVGVQPNVADGNDRRAEQFTGLDSSHVVASPPRSYFAEA